MPRNSRAEKERKRHAVAAAVIAGQRTSITARHLGCSARHVRRLAAERDTFFLIAEVLRPLVPQFVALIPWVLNAIKQGLTAMKTDEADHLTRLNAVIRFCKLLKMAEGQRLN